MSTSPKPSRSKRQDDPSYWASTHRPLQCLMFLVPLLILYEVGVILYATEFVPGKGELPIHIVARTMLIEFFSRLHIQVPGIYLPGLIIVIVLLGWHIARKDPWRIEPKLYGWMFIEAAGLALPIFSIHLIVYYLVMTLQEQMDSTQLSWMLAGGAKEQYGWQRGMVWSVGAALWSSIVSNTTWTIPVGAFQKPQPIGMATRPCRFTNPHPPHQRSQSCENACVSRDIRPHHEWTSRYHHAKSPSL